MNATGMCRRCGAAFTPRKASQQFCSKSCSARSRKGLKADYVKSTCQHCGTQWERRTRSREAKYCSKACEFAHLGYTAREERACEQCGSTFLSKFRKDRGTWEEFCSIKCVGKHASNAVSKTCPVCEETFTAPPSRADVTCSWACRRAMYVRDRTSPWKGGVVVQDGRVYRRIDRRGYAGRYEGEHRLIAAREIGRTLERGEVVICVNGDNQDWRPENLFLCPSQSAWAMIRSGSVEWPAKGNLKQYKLEGYVSPPVKIVLHEWTDGKRRLSRSGKPAQRHPQADEIIKRRKAGATVRQLADAFDTSKNVMAYALKNRL